MYICIYIYIHSLSASFRVYSFLPSACLSPVGLLCLPNNLQCISSLLYSPSSLPSPLSLKPNATAPPPALYHIPDISTLLFALYMLLLALVHFLSSPMQVPQLLRCTLSLPSPLSFLPCSLSSVPTSLSVMPYATAPPPTLYLIPTIFTLRLTQPDRLLALFTLTHALCNCPIMGWLRLVGSLKL